MCVGDISCGDSETVLAPTLIKGGGIMISGRAAVRAACLRVGVHPSIRSFTFISPECMEVF